MRPILRSLLRIFLAVAIIIGAVIVVVRQPTITSLPFRPATRASAARLREDLRVLTSAPRDAEHSAWEADYIAHELTAAGGRLTSQPFAARGATFRNVVAAFGPRDNRQPPLIVGAHYDAFGDAGNYPGADDNASGTAGLLELARILGRTPPATPVLIVAFANEEPPFFASEEMGSAIHAASIEGQPIAGMICLEMIGYYTAHQNWTTPVLGAIYPSHGDFIAVTGGWSDRTLARHVKRAIAGAGGIGVVSFTGPRSMLDASDQRNYWARGRTAVMVTDTAYLRNPNYHTARDTAATLDYSRMARVVDGIANAVLQ
ncbi:MAG: peptidase [Acidobacteria bacterium]|nr:peptidase [Acidobacteriota bacterium]